MTIHKFASAVITLKLEFEFSITSWIRSQKRNREVGGNAESFHLCGLGIDCVLDIPTSKDYFIKRAQRLGIKAIDEGDHVHLQPAD